MKFERNYFTDIINQDGSLFLLDKFISDKLSYYKSKRNFDLGSYKKIMSVLFHQRYQEEF